MKRLLGELDRTELVVREMGKRAVVNYWKLWYEQVRAEQVELLHALRGLVALTGDEDEKTQDEAWEKAREVVALHSVDEE